MQHRFTRNAAVVLAIVGVVAVGLRQPNDAYSPPDRSAITSAPTVTAVWAPTTAAAPVGPRVTRTPVSPVDTVAPRPVSPPVLPTPPTGATAVIVDGPSCTIPLRLTVLEIDGCPISGLIGALESITREAVALPR